jgi:glutamyl-tRNA reductase
LIAVIGLSHKTAGIAVREKLAVAREQIPELLAAVVSRPSIGEAMLVSTCNRAELVVAGRQGGEAELTTVASEAAEELARRAPDVSRHLYTHVGGSAVRHLFRVAASLDSLVLGEPQILGQVKDAFQVARAAGTLGPVLHRAVPRALRAAKRVRTETSIGAGLVSVPSVAVDLSRQIFGDLSRHTVVLIGSGEMAETVAKLLKGAGSRLMVVGRNRGRVAELATAVGGEPREWTDLSLSLIEADVVITSTSAQDYVVGYDHVHGHRRKRRGRSLFFIDLAVPRDVDPRVEQIEGVFLYNIDDFSRVVAETHSTRQREAERAEAIVEMEAAGYDRWADAARVTPTLVALRNRMRRALSGELDKSLRTKLKHLGPEERAALEKMVEAALNKMLHVPTTLMREIAADREDEAWRAEQLASALVELFALGAEPDASGDEATNDETQDDAAIGSELPRAPAAGTGGR